MELADVDLLVGFDTEYVADHASAQNGETLEFDPDKIISRGNRVLCISYALHSPSTGQRFSGMVLIPPSRKRRWTLKQFIEQVLDAAVESGMISWERMRAADDRHPRCRRQGLRIILCGHFTRADLPGFADFPVLKRKFNAVRQTYTTIMRPHVFTARPGRYRAQVSITLRDTRLLTPAGYGSLAAIGQMLGRPKLEVPDVIDEKGISVAGITRMDLVQLHHPDAFDTYAVRDAEVALTYLVKVHELACELGVPEFPATIGSLAVKMFREGCADFAGFMGLVPDPERPQSLKLHHHISLNAGIWADGFHGGMNQCFAHGIFDTPPDRAWHDVDLASAYTVAMAAIPTIDWDRPSTPIRLEEIATIEAATVARIRFRFPPGTRYPCLPVRTDIGLIFPLEGETTSVGIEILAAVNMGASIEVLAAHRFEFASPNHEYAVFTRRIAAYRARFKVTNPLFEKLVKEVGNSLYGKTAQAVAGMRSEKPDRTRMFDTLSGQRHELPASAVTNPVHAAMITATIRATLGEILSSLPPDCVILSVTTDGFLTSATLEEAMAATGGPICSHFRKALEAVAPGKALLEEKHRAASVAVARTRGAFTVAAADGYAGPPILARAGHRLETPPPDAWAEAAEFVRLFRDRRPDTKLLGRDFIDVETQWMADADLVSLPVSHRLNLDYDFGRRPIKVEEAHGLLRFATAPWPSLRAHRAARAAHARLRASGGHLKTIADWRRIEADINAAAAMTCTALDDLCLRWLRTVAAVHLCGEGKPMTLAEGAAAMTELGLPTTPQQMLDAGKKARYRNRKSSGKKRGTSASAAASGLPGHPERMDDFIAARIAKMGGDCDQPSISKNGAILIEFARKLISSG